MIKYRLVLIFPSTFSDTPNKLNSELLDSKPSEEEVNKILSKFSEGTYEIEEVEV